MVAEASLPKPCPLCLIPYLSLSSTLGQPHHTTGHALRTLWLGEWEMGADASLTQHGGVSSYYFWDSQVLPSWQGRGELIFYLLGCLYRWWKSSEFQAS